MLMGMKSVRAKVRGLERALERGAQSAVKEAACVACEEAVRRAPVKTGRLKRSIEVRAEGTEAAVVADCPYAAAVELGSPRRGPHPFLLPAAQSARSDFLRAAAVAMKDALGR